MRYVGQVLVILSLVQQEDNSLHKLQGTTGLKLLGTTGLEILGRICVCIVDNQVIVPMSVLDRLPDLKGVELVVVPMSCLGSLLRLEGVEVVIDRFLLEHRKCFATAAKSLVLCELPTLKITGEDDSIHASHEVVASSSGRIQFKLITQVLEETVVVLMVMVMEEG